MFFRKQHIDEEIDKNTNKRNIVKQNILPTLIQGITNSYQGSELKGENQHLHY